MSHVEDRLAFVTNSIRATTIPHERMTLAHERFDRLAAANGRLTCEYECLPMIASSFAGKTSIASTYARTRNDAEQLKAGRVNVLHVTLPPQCTAARLYESILSELSRLTSMDTSANKRGESRFERVLRFESLSGLRLLILDEFQHAVSHNPTVAWKLGEHIKDLLIQGCCPIVLSGVERARNPIKLNAQLRNRSITPIDLSRLEVVRNDHTSYFQDFVVRYIDELRVQDLAGNIDIFAEYLAEMLEISQGFLGRTCRFIEHAIRNMIEAERNDLVWEDLAQAADGFVAQGRHYRNPIRDGAAELRPELLLD
jgi:hypothetical protein